ncbi:site-specific integrase [Cytobacillus pseudoceanisediminis]|uniref:site-specific integrase n=1 Tax=Cytobacillus pseudoceanisediminis TaxID=3051614 RepID=UPI00364B042D
MPYGYEEYRLSKGISPKTTYVEVRVIRELLAFVSYKYKRHLEPREIKPIDIREFLLQQKQQNKLKDATINRKIITIRNWFDYLWNINKIEIDFMPKFKMPEKLDKSKAKIEVNYDFFLSKKSEVLQSSKVQLYAKALLLFYLKGVRVRDIVKVSLDQIQDHQDHLIVKIPKKNGYIQQVQFEEDEMGIILECMERAIFRGTPYLLSSKVNSEYIPLQLGSFKDYLYSLKEFLGVPIRSEQIRLAYVHYLYTKKMLKIEDLQAVLGGSLPSVSSTLKEALERVEDIEYNKQQVN